MDAREVLYTTRAMRRLRPDPIGDDVIARIVDAGVRAPSPGAVQTWRFLIVTDRSVMADVGRLWRATRDALLVERPNLYASKVQAASSDYLAEHFDDVPLLILGYGPAAVGATTVVPALWSMCLAARAEGLGATFTTLLTRAEADLAAILGGPDDDATRLFGVVPIGAPLGRWGVAPRQPANEVTYANRWGQPVAWTAPGAP